MARTITVTFLGNAKDLQRATDQAAGSTDTLTSKMKRFGAFAAAGLAVAGGAAIKFGADSVRSASDLNETLNKSRVIFGENAGAMERWATGAAKSAGLSKAAALEAASGFGNMFDQLGFGGEQAAKMSRGVVQLSADLGSFNNLPTAEVADMMSAAFRGEYDSLQRLIPNINAARVESEALAMTGKTTADSLTAQEKAAATLAIVQKDGAKASGDFARTSGSLANQQKILKAQFENVSASVGQKLLPIVTKFVTWLNDTALPGMSKFAGWLRSTFGPVFGWLRDKAGGSLGGMRDDFQKTFRTIVNAVKAFVGTAREFWAKHGEDIKALARNAWNVIKGIVKGALTIIRGVMKVATGIMRGDWSKAWSGIKDILRGAFKILVSIVKGAMAQMRTLLAAALSAIRDRVRIAWDAIKAATREAWQRVVDAVRDKISDVVAKVRGIKGAVLGVLAGAGSWLYEKGKAILQGLWDGLKAKWEQIKAWFGGLRLPNFPGGGGGGRTTGPGTGNLGKASASSGALFSGPASTYASTTGVTGVTAGGATVVINVSGALDPDAVARQIVTLLRRYQRVTGTPLGLS